MLQGHAARLRVYGVPQECVRGGFSHEKRNRYLPKASLLRLRWWPWSAPRTPTTPCASPRPASRGGCAIELTYTTPGVNAIIEKMAREV